MHFLTFFWLKKRGKNQQLLINTMFYLVRPFFFTLSSILNLRSSTFAHRSGPSYHFSVLPCDPCNFSPFLYPFPPFYFPLLITVIKQKLTSSLLLLSLCSLVFSLYTPTQLHRKSWHWHIFFNTGLKNSPLSLFLDPMPFLLPHPLWGNEWICEAWPLRRLLNNKFEYSFGL